MNFFMISAYSLIVKELYAFALCMTRAHFDVNVVCTSNLLCCEKAMVELPHVVVGIGTGALTIS